MLGAALADPNVAFLLLVLGALGVYWEVHAPGMVLPGLLGTSYSVRTRLGSLTFSSLLAGHQRLCDLIVRKARLS